MARLMTPEFLGAKGGTLQSRLPTRHEFRGVLALALPVAAVQVGMMAMGVVDTVMVGHYSARDLAAVALGNLYFFTAAVFPMGVLMALDPVVSQAVGAGDHPAVGRGLQRGAVLALALGFPGALVLVPGEPILHLLRQPPEVVPVASGYALAAIPGLFPFLAFIVFRQTLQAMGRVAPIVATILLANLANFFFNWVLIFGRWGFPELGAVGSGWASSLSRWLMFLGLLGFSWPLLKRYLRPIRPEVFLLRPLARMLRLGSPIGVQFGLEYGAFGTTGLLMGWLGTVAMAGHQVALNLASLTFMVPLGISQATAVLVGHGVGRETPRSARRAAGAGLLLGAAFMAATALVFLLFPAFLARFYSRDSAVLALATILIPLAGVFQVFDGLQVVASGVLRGVGDTRSPMLLNLLGFWCIGMPVGLWLAFRRGMGPVGLWWGLVLGLASVATLLLVRVRTRMAKALPRVVIDDE
ncbi:MAG: MATE family efflux transporter [Longimicrobiales bacterium]